MAQTASTQTLAKFREKARQLIARTDINQKATARLASDASISPAYHFSSQLDASDGKDLLLNTTFGKEGRFSYMDIEGQLHGYYTEGFNSHYHNQVLIAPVFNVPQCSLIH